LANPRALWFEKRPLTTETETEDFTIRVMTGQAIEERRTLAKEGKSTQTALGKYKATIEAVDVDINSLEARTVDEVTRAYNQATQELRRELFDPPIPDLTNKQLRSALLDTAKMYHRQGSVEIASAFEKSAEADCSEDRLKYADLVGQ
jgi:hypothetical protein